jgi:hypothetical protein
MEHIPEVEEGEHESAYKPKHAPKEEIEIIIEPVLSSSPEQVKNAKITPHEQKESIETKKFSLEMNKIKTKKKPKISKLIDLKLDKKNYVSRVSGWRFNKSTRASRKKQLVNSELNQSSESSQKKQDYLRLQKSLISKYTPRARPSKDKNHRRLRSAIYNRSMRGASFSTKSSGSKIPSFIERSSSNEIGHSNNITFGEQIKLRKILKVLGGSYIDKRKGNKTDR